MLIRRIVTGVVDHGQEAFPMKKVAQATFFIAVYPGQVKSDIRMENALCYPWFLNGLAITLMISERILTTITSEPVTITPAEMAA